MCWRPRGSVAVDMGVSDDDAAACDQWRLKTFLDRGKGIITSQRSICLGRADAHERMGPSTIRRGRKRQIYHVNR